MTDLLYDIFGEENNINTLQMCCRAILLFFITLILLRIAGRRSFSLNSPFDNVLAILIGAIMSRILVGASPFLPTTAACVVLAVLHRIVAILCVHYTLFDRLTKGSRITVFANGKFIKNKLYRSLISKQDIIEEARLKNLDPTLRDIAEINLERNGKVSFTKRQ